MNGFEPNYIRLTCRRSTLRIINTSTAPNAIIYNGEFERSTTGITRVILHVSWSSCGLSNIIASLSKQLLALSCILFVQALRTTSKTTAIWLVTCMIGRAKKVGLLSQSLLTLRSRVFSWSLFGWLFASCTLYRDFVFVCEGCSSNFASNNVVSPHSLPAVRNLYQMS